MSGFNGSGTFQISGVGLPYTTGTIISSSVANQLNTDLASGLSTCILKDGTQTVTANIPFNNYNINNISAVGIGTASPLYPLHIKSGATELFSVTSAGNATTTGTNTSASFIPTSSTAPTNGMYLSAANTLAFSTNSANRFTISSTGDATATGSITATTHIPTGSTAPTNGMYLSAANTLAFSTNSVNRFTISSTGNTTATGSSTATSFIPTSSTAPSDGIFLVSTNVLGFSTNSVERFRISNTGGIFSGTFSLSGTMLAASYEPTSSTPPQIGMYKSGTNTLSFSTNTNARLTITSTGDIRSATSATTTMAAGFVCISAAAGIPTGVPSVSAGAVPMYYDTTNNNFYVYNGAWKKVALT